MDILQMKLAMTVDLMNQPTTHDPVDFALEKMGRFADETGDYQGFTETNRSQIGESMGWKTLQCRFEHYTLNLELVEDMERNEEFIQSFDILAN